MNEIDAIKNRHSVREYLDKPIEEEKVKKLRFEIEKINAEQNLNIQLVIGDAETFNGNKPHYGRFVGVKNYIALVGEKCKDLDFKLGYFGEKLVLLAQILGLNTCWVALTYRKNKAKVKVMPSEKLVCVIALGYGKNSGVQHKSKDISKVSNVTAASPEWFKKSVELALLAPTAINQQQFFFTLTGENVTCKAGIGFYAKVDLGIVKYHFDVGLKEYKL